MDWNNCRGPEPLAWEDRGSVDQAPQRHKNWPWAKHEITHFTWEISLIFTGDCARRSLSVVVGEFPLHGSKPPQARLDKEQTMQDILLRKSWASCRSRSRGQGSSVIVKWSWCCGLHPPETNHTIWGSSTSSRSRTIGRGWGRVGGGSSSCKRARTSVTRRGTGSIGWGAKHPRNSRRGRARDRAWCATAAPSKVQPRASTAATIFDKLKYLYSKPGQTLISSVGQFSICFSVCFFLGFSFASFYKV